jgi:acetyl/propionyl-CoA carboxylase alpha subunit
VFYDSMIAKLVAWGDSRPEAIARLGRALDEYRVVGVKTTVPFFRWLMRQVSFHEGRFDTTFLDRVLAERAGTPFVEPTDDETMDAAIVAALGSSRRAALVPPAPPVSDWRRAAKIEALRTDISL